jgi:3',5'-cyclic AMP phosphodiesterase CpdA
VATLAHISDLHFGREVPAVVEALLDDLSKLMPDAVIVSGDLTQRARSREFKAASRFVQAIPFPVVMIPGNHDQSAWNPINRFFHPWQKWRKYFGDSYPGDFLQPSVEGEEFSIIGVNTARAFTWGLDWSQGAINASQCDSVADFFSTVPDSSLRVLITHHPFWLPAHVSDRGLIRRRDWAMSRLAKAGVDMILSGHVHLDFCHLLDGIVVSHAGTATSDRLLPGSPNSFNVLRGNRDGVKIAIRSWDGQQFAQSGLRDFRRDRGRWYAL